MVVRSIVHAPNKRHRILPKQIEICISSNDHATEEASTDAKAMFFNNSLPNVDLEGSPDNAKIPQPANKDQLINGLLNLKSEMNELSILIPRTSYKGKTRHPGLNYFNANEWLQLAEMHFRHHLRQKKNIDNFLKGSI